MKTIATICLLSPLFTLFAQEKFNNPYWVIERNIKQKDLTYVKIYSEQHELVQEIKIEGREIDISKRRDKRMLDHLVNKYANRELSIRKRNKSKSSV